MLCEIAKKQNGRRLEVFFVEENTLSLRDKMLGAALVVQFLVETKAANWNYNKANILCIVKFFGCSEKPDTQALENFEHILETSLFPYIQNKIERVEQAPAVMSLSLIFSVLMYLKECGRRIKMMACSLQGPALEKTLLRLCIISVESE